MVIIIAHWKCLFRVISGLCFYKYSIPFKLLLYIKLQLLSFPRCWPFKVIKQMKWFNHNLFHHRAVVTNERGEVTKIFLFKRTAVKCDERLNVVPYLIMPKQAKFMVWINNMIWDTSSKHRSWGSIIFLFLWLKVSL